MEREITTMPCVAFANGVADVSLASKFLANISACRVELTSGKTVFEKVKSKGLSLWIDPAIDGFDRLLTGSNSFGKYHNEMAEAKRKGVKRRKNEWMEFFGSRKEFEHLADPSFVKKPSKPAITKLVNTILDECKAHDADWISVPQLPVTVNTDRNRINLLLAQTAGVWCENQKQKKCQLVLPCLFTHRAQTHGKTIWKAKANHFKKCRDASGASMMWVVDTSLDDAAGRPTDHECLKQLIRLHEYLKSVSKGHWKCLTGPYWAFQLVLRSRGLCDIPIIGAGGGSRYYIPGGMPMRGKTRIPLSPLRRKAIASPDLKAWLQSVVPNIPKSDLHFFQALLENWEKKTVWDMAKSDTMRLYKRWISELSSVEPDGQSVAMFQILSAAYVLGAPLDDLPSDEGSGRKPGQVAQQLMLHCLS